MFIRMKIQIFYDIIIAEEKQAPQSGICFSEEIEDFLYDITGKRPMKSDRARCKREFASEA